MRIFLESSAPVISLAYPPLFAVKKHFANFEKPLYKIVFLLYTLSCLFPYLPAFAPFLCLENFGNGEKRAKYA
jgi:hypothetical protein